VGLAIGITRAQQKAGKEMGSPMMIGAAIAGLLIISLFLEMVSSSPKPSEERNPTPEV
jgi:hypothetical protein